MYKIIYYFNKEVIITGKIKYKKTKDYLYKENFKQFQK